MTQQAGPQERRESSRRSTLRQGAVAVLVAILLPVFLILSAYSINVAYMHLSRTELRTVTDSAARAAGRRLSLAQASGLTPEQSVDAATVEAKNAASKNRVAGDPLILVDADIEFGMNTRNATDTGWEFTADPNRDGRINAVRVTGRRTEGSNSGLVPLFFTGFLDQKTFDPVMTSVSMQIDRDIVLVVDRAGCMRRVVDDPMQDYAAGLITGPEYARLMRSLPTPENPMKWTVLTQAVELFLQTVEATVTEEKVALASFNAEVSRDVELTFDYGEIRAAMAAHTAAGLYGVPDIQLGLAEGLAQALNAATARPFAEKTIVLLTDGCRGDPTVDVTNAANDHGVTVHTITFGDVADQELMAETAELGGGGHWHAEVAEPMTEACEEIALDIPTVLTE